MDTTRELDALRDTARSHADCIVADREKCIEVQQFKKNNEIHTTNHYRVEYLIFETPAGDATQEQSRRANSYRIAPVQFSVQFTVTKTNTGKEMEGESHGRVVARSRNIKTKQAGRALERENITRGKNRASFTKWRRKKNAAATACRNNFGR